MFVKIHKKPRGIPKAGMVIKMRVDANDGLGRGLGRVAMFISAFDHFDMPTTVCSVRLTVDEIRKLAADLTRIADETGLP